ncbi:hypothetical protein BIW11_13686 [Tropilaelaps mercedesae]|uniref:Translation initiation factor eIF2B subunit delta n=1 Tax=Tropilaelaps mercedesae TaxID=418985 RepID=A0A1V9X1P9_9ACAR|nr:hypothetical protein BIW11_13686 [Tropilaelaps mercedesae]
MYAKIRQNAIATNEGNVGKKKKKSKNNKKSPQPPPQSKIAAFAEAAKIPETGTVEDSSVASSKETTPARTTPEVSIIPLSQASPSTPIVSSTPVNSVSAGAGGDEVTKDKKKRKKKKKRSGGGASGDTETGGIAGADDGDAEVDGPEVTVIPLNKDPGVIPPHLNPAIVHSPKENAQVPKVIECSPVVTLIGSSKKTKEHGALYNPAPPPILPTPPKEDPPPNEQVQTISGGFKFPSSLQPVFETAESIAVSTGVVLNQETSGVLTIVPIRQEGEKKRRNRNKILQPCCELRGRSGLEVVCPHSNKPIPNYNFIVNEDKEKSRQLQETQASLQHIDDPEVLDSLASIDHSVTIKLVGGGVAPQTTVHREGAKNKTILVEAADAMKKTAAKGGSEISPPTVKLNGVLPEDADKAEKARLKAERKAAFEAKRAAELAEQQGDGKENKRNLTKAERRALQEAQRAKKAQAQEGVKGDATKQVKSKAALPTSSKEASKKEPSSAAEKKKESNANKKVSFADMPSTTTPFAHMHVRGEGIDKLSRYCKDTPLHPAVFQLGFQIAEGRVAGANNRCIGMLDALQKLVHDFGLRKDQEKKDVRQLSKELGSQIDENVAFLDHCRPLSVSMANALSYVKATMNEETSEARSAGEFAAILEEAITRFVHNEIGLARTAIIGNAKDKITDGDMVLTYARYDLHTLYDSTILLLDSSYD